MFGRSGLGSRILLEFCKPAPGRISLNRPATCAHRQTDSGPDPAKGSERRMVSGRAGPEPLLIKIPVEDVQSFLRLSEPAQSPGHSLETFVN